MGKQDNVTGWRVGGGQGMAKEGSVGLPEVVGDGEMEIREICRSRDDENGISSSKQLTFSRFQGQITLVCTKRDQAGVRGMAIGPSCVAGGGWGWRSGNSEIRRWCDGKNGITWSK